jgi:hypothetical protein
MTVHIFERFNAFVYNITGCYESFLKWGDWFAYDKSPRANMFRRDQSKVVDIDSMIRLMRYNNYTLDELARCDCDPPFSAENTIAARSDLNPSNGRYPFDALGHRDHGATDLKVYYPRLSQTGSNQETHTQTKCFI